MVKLSLPTADTLLSVSALGAGALGAQVRGDARVCEQRDAQQRASSVTTDPC
jgi:hypothetical protein